MTELFVAPLVVVKAMDGNLRGKLRFQKLVCLLEAESKRRGTFTIGFPFKAYHYGPFSRELARTVDFLVNQGFLTERAEPTTSGRIQYVYSLTLQGNQAIDDFLRQAHASALNEAAVDVARMAGYLPIPLLVEKAYGAFHFLQAETKA
jgi:uncharacterized protein YwgA